MGKVSLNINGRAYGLGCEDGEEERLNRLGQKLDTRVAEMAHQFGQIGDLRLLVMAGITLLDEMESPAGSDDSKTERRIKALETETEAARTQTSRTESEAVDGLMKAAERIEKLAERLSGAGRD